MEINDTMDFIRNVYDTYNISHSILIYDKDEIMMSDVEDLYAKLVHDDYPILEVKSVPDNLVSLESKYRMFMLDEKTFKKFIEKKNNNLSNVSVIFCLSSTLLHNTCELLREHNVKTLNSMHLFSC